MFDRARRGARLVRRPFIRRGVFQDDIDWAALPHLLPLRTTAKVLGVHPNTLRAWDQRGMLRAVRLGPRQDRRYPREAVQLLHQSRQPLVTRLPRLSEPRVWRPLAVGAVSLALVVILGWTSAVIAGGDGARSVPLQPEACTGWVAGAEAVVVDVSSPADPSAYTTANSASIASSALRVSDHDQSDPGSALDQIDPSLTCRGFGGDRPADSLFSNASLQINVAATGQADSLGVFFIESSTDGVHWTTLKTFRVGDQTVGQQHIDLTGLTASQLNGVMIRVRADLDPIDQSSLAVDSVAIVADYHQAEKIDRKNIDRVKRQVDALTAFSQQAYRSTEQPVLRVPKKKVEKVFFFFKHRETTWTIKNVAATDVTGNTSALEYHTVDQTEGQDVFSSVRLDTHNLHPGKYKLTLTSVSSDGVQTTIAKDFLWGVAAINVTHAMAKPGVDQVIGMGVLDDSGVTICDAKVSLTVKSPTGKIRRFSMDKETIKTSGQCVDKGVTNVADYYVHYKVQETGLYHLTMVAETKAGERRVEESFQSDLSLQFDVDRFDYPTRIYPLSPYQVRVAITPSQNYKGFVREHIPDGFAIARAFPDGTVQKSSDGQPGGEILWPVHWVKGQTYFLSYRFDAPDISPALFLMGPLKIGGSALADADFQEPRQWQIASDSTSTGSSGYAPTSGTLVTGTNTTRLAATASANTGVNVGSYQGTLAEDNMHWSVLGANANPNFDVQLNFDGTQLSGANKIIVQTRFDTDANVGLQLQICDWTDSQAAGNFDSAEDANCTDGTGTAVGWRSLMSVDAADTILTYTGTTSQAMQWHLRNGSWATGTTGGTALNVPLSNFVQSGTNQVKIRFFSATASATNLDIDYLRVIPLIDSVYEASGFTKITGGTVVGTYLNTNVIGNSAAGPRVTDPGTSDIAAPTAIGDAVSLDVPGTAGAISDFYLSYQNVQTYTGMNTIYVRSDFRCSTTGINITPKIYNFNSTAWENLTSTAIACSATDATRGWAKNNVTISNYISSGEVRIGWFGSANNTLSIRIDAQYIMLGSTNSDSAKCEISFGTGTATNCTNTRDLDSTGTTNSFDVTAADLSNTFANDFYPLDNAGSATLSREASSSNISFPVTPPSAALIVSTHFAGRFDAGTPNTTAAMAVRLAARDYAGNPTSTSGSGGWTLVGTAGTSTSTAAASNIYRSTDSVVSATSNTSAIWGMMDNAEDRIDFVNNLMNLRLPTTTVGLNTNNVVTKWDFAMVSIAWINTTEHPHKQYQFVPTGSVKVTGGADPARLGNTAAGGGGVNTAQGTGGWKATLADDNFHWTVLGAAAVPNIDAQLNVDGVQLNGANNMIIQTELDTDAAIALNVQICDWISTTSVDNALDAQCTGGGWRTLNSQNASNADVTITTVATGVAVQWHIFDGYFTTGTTGGSAVSTPLTNFVKTATNQVKIRYFSNTSSATNLDIDFLRIIPVIDSVYHPSGFTQITGGTVAGTYANAFIVGNTSTTQQSTATTNAAGDAVYLSVPGTAGAISDFYFKFRNIKLYNGMNTIYVRSEYSCSTTGINLTPKIFNFKTNAWENLTSGTIACSATDAMGGWAKNNVTVTDYIQNGELRAGWFGSANNTLSLRIDDMFIILGSTNSDTAQCQASFGTGTATNCSNTRTIDLTGTVSSFANAAEDESNTFGHDFISMDTDADATVEEASSSNISMTVALPSNAMPVGEHFAGRFAAGFPNTTTAMTVQMGLRDYAGVPTLTAGVGGWDAVGATAAAAAGADTYTHTDSLSVLAANVYGNLNNPNENLDSTNDLMNIRLRTTASGTTTNNVTAQWDFAFTSVMWVESTGVTVSGNMYTNETLTALDCSTGGNRTVSLKINGAGTYSADCTLNTGFYSIPNVPIPYAGAVITVYLDGETEKGSTTTLANDGTSAITGLNIYTNKLNLTHENAGPIINDNIRLFDSTGDADLQYSVTALALTSVSGTELRVNTSKTYTPGGTITTNVTGGDFRVLGTSTIDTATTVIGSDIIVPTGGTLNINAAVLVNGGDITTSGTGTVTTTAGTPSVTMGSTGSIGGGSNVVTVHGLIISSAVTTTTTSALTANSTITISTPGILNGTTDIIAKGNVWGDGTITRTGGTFTQRVAVNQSFGVSSGSSTWTFNNLTFSDSDGSNARTVAMSAGTGQIVVNGTLQIGDSGDGQNTTLDNETANDRVIDANGAVNITTKGVLLASSTQAFTVAGNWTNSNTFTANSGTVTLDGAAQQQDLSGTLSGVTGKFNALTVTNALGNGTTTWSVTFAGNTETAATFTAATASTKLRFNATSTYTFQNIVFNGGAVGTRVFLRSSTGGSAWLLNVAGTRSVLNTDVKDSNATGSGTAIDATNSSNLDSTGNTNWNFPVIFTVSGGCFTDDTEGTPCTDDGADQFKVAVNGVVDGGVDTAVDGAGAWTFTLSSPPGSGAIMVFFRDGEATASQEATTVVKYDGTGNIDLVKMYESQLVIGTDSGSLNTDQTLTVADLDTTTNGYENSDDANVLYDVTAGADLTVDAAGTHSEKFYVINGDTYRPASGGGSDTTTLGLTIDASAVITADNNLFNVAGNFTNAGTFTANTSTVTLNGAAAQTVTTNAQSFNILTLNNTGADGATDNVTISGALDVNGAFNITNGDLVLSTNDPNVTTASDVTIGSSAFVTKADNGSATWTFDGTTAATYTDSVTTKQDLGLVTINKTDTGAPATNDKVTLASSMTVSKMTIDGTVSQADTLNLASSGFTLKLTGDGASATVLTVSGTLTPGTSSTVQYAAVNSGGNVNVVTTTYNSLDVSPSATETYVLTGHLTGGNKLTGSLTIGSNGTLDTTSGSNFGITLDGSWTNNGVFTANTATQTFSSGGSQTLSGTLSGSSAFGNVAFSNASGSWSVNSAMDVNGTFAVTAGTVTEAANMKVVGTAFTLSSGVTWTHSSGTLIIDGSGSPLLFADNTSPKQNMGTLQIGASPGVTTLTTDLTAKSVTVATADTFNTKGYDVTTTLGAFTVNGTGILDMSDSGGSNEGDGTIIDDYGDFTMSSSGTLTADTSKVFMNNTAGANTNRTWTTGGKAYNLVELKNAGTTNDQITISGNVDVNNTFTLTDGTIKADTSNPTTNTAGDVTIASAATYTKGTSTWTFDGIAPKIYTDSTATPQNIGVVAITKTDGTPANNKITLASSMTVNTMTVSASNTLDLVSSGYILKVANVGATGTVLTISGTLSPGTNSTVQFSATNSGGTVVVPATTYYHLQLSGNETYDLGGNLTSTNAVAGGITIDAGGATLDAVSGSNFNIALAGAWTNNGIFTARTGSVTMTGSVNLTGSSATTFNNLTINGTNSTVTVATSDPTVSGTLTIGGASDGNTDVLSIGVSRTVSATGTTTLTDSTDTISGAGTLRFTSTSSGPGTTGTLSSIVRFDATTGDIPSATVDARPYEGAVQFYSNSGSAQIITFPGTTMDFNSTMTIEAAGAGTLNVTGATNDPAYDLEGNFSMVAGGGVETFTTGSGNWNAAGSVDLTNGTYTTEGTHKLIMDGTGTLTSDNETLLNLDINSAGTVTLAGATHTMTGNLLLGGAGTPTVTSSTISMTGSGKTITGGGKTLNNLTLDGGGTTTLQTSDLTVIGILTLAGSKTLTITGVTVTMNATSAEISWGASSVISGTGTLTFTDGAGGPGTGGTLSTAVTRFDVTNGDIASTTFDARTYGGIVEPYSASSSNRTVTMSGTYILSGSGSHFNPNASAQGDLFIDGGTNNPTVTIGGNLDFTGSGTVVLASGDGTWTVTGNVDLTGGIYGPQLATLTQSTPIWDDSALQDDLYTVASCPSISSTSYSCTGSSTNTIGNNDESGLCDFQDSHNLTYRIGEEYDLSGISDSAIITQVQFNPTVASATSGSVNIGRSSADNLQAENCTISSGTFSKISSSEYLSGSTVFNSTGTKIIDLGSTAITDVQARIGAGAKYSIGINSGSTLGTLNSDSSSSGQPMLRVAYVVNTTSTLIMNGTGKTLTSAGNHLYNLTLSGTITLANATHTVDGNLDMTGGDVTPGTSTVLMAGVSKTLTAPVAGDTLANLTIDPQSAGTVTLAAGGGNLTVSSLLTTASGDTLSIGSARTLTLSGASGTTLTNNGTISGAGTLTYQNTATAFPAVGTISSILRMDATANNQSIGGTNSATRTFGGVVEIYTNSSGTGKTVTLENGSSRTFTFASNLYLIADNSQNITLTADTTTDPTVNVTGDVDFTGTGGGTEVLTSGGNTWTVNGNVDFANGQFDATTNNTFTIAGSTASSTFDSACANTDSCVNQNFYNLTINKTSGTDANDNVTLTNNGINVANTLTITDGELVQGALNVRAEGSSAVSIAAAGKWSNISTGDIKLGGSLANTGTLYLDVQGNSNGCSGGDTDDISLDSTDTNVRSISGAGTFTLYDVTVNHMNATVAITDNGGTDGGTNTGSWTFIGCGITITGTIYQADELSIYNCSGVGNDITLHTSTNGAANRDGSCTAPGGTFTMTADTPASAGDPVVIYFDTGETQQATTVTLASATPTANISGLDLIVSRLVLTHENAGPMTNAKLATGDNGNAGIRYAVVTSVTDNLTVDSGIELHVKSSKTFTPAGTVTTNATGGLFHVLGTSTLDTASNVIGAGITVPSGGALHINTTTSVGGTITVAGTGAIDTTAGTGVLTMSATSSITGDGTFNVYGLATSGTAVLTFNSSGTNSIGAGGISVPGSTTININSNVSNAGSLTNATSGVIATTAGTPTITMTGASPSIGGGTTGAITIYNLTTSGTGTFTFSNGGTNTFNNNVSVGAGTTLKLNSSLTITGLVTNTSTGIITTDSGTPTVTVNGTGNFCGGNANTCIFYNLIFGGTPTFQSDPEVKNNLTLPSSVTANSKTVTMTGTAGALVGGGATLYNLTIDPSSAGTITMQTSDLTVSNTLTVATGDALTINNAARILTLSNNASNSLTMTGGTLNGPGTLVYQNATANAFPTDGTLGTSTAIRFDTVNGNLNVPVRTDYDTVIAYKNGITARSVILGTAASQTLTLSANLDVQNANATNALTLDGNTNTPVTMNITGNVTNSVGTGDATVSMGAGVWTVSGNFDLTNVDTLNNNSGTLTMNGSAQQTLTAAGKTLYNVTITNNSGLDPDSSPSVIFADGLTATGTLTAVTANTKLRFNAGSTYAPTAINLNGQAIGTRVFLRSSTPGTTFAFSAGAGSRTVSNTTIKDSDACGSNGGSIDASDGTNLDATNNSCWLITKLQVSISGDPVALGSLSASTVAYDGITSTITSNSASGYVSVVKYDNTLTSGSNTIADAAGDNDVDPGSSEFGASTSKASQTITQSTASPVCSETRQTQGSAAAAKALTTSFQQFASSTGIASGDATTLCFLASIPSTQAAGVYTSTMTVVTTARF